MKYSDKIVTTFPLENLWNEHEEILATREQSLNKEKIKQMISLQPVEFVVAEIGEKLKWVGVNECYKFWKSEVEKHLVNDTDEIILDNYPEGYAYLASEWKTIDSNSIIVLEMMH
jgi:hypothetical protein